MSDSFKKVQKILQHYSRGDFQYIIDNLDIDDYNQLSIELYKLQSSYNSYYEQIREFVVTTLKALYQALLQTVKINELIYEAKENEENLSILRDKKKLIAYLEKLKRTMGNLFEDYHIRVQGATLKQEFQIYIQLYGFPPNAVFDPDLLAPIVESLN